MCEVTILLYTIIVTGMIIDNKILLKENITTNGDRIVCRIIWSGLARRFLHQEFGPLVSPSSGFWTAMPEGSPPSSCCCPGPRGRPPRHNPSRSCSGDIQHSHWSSSYNAALSLVENFRVLKYFHALKGPIIGALSDATPAILFHKEPARRKNPLLGVFVAPRWFFMA